jgi:hypothetical protein
MGGCTDWSRGKLVLQDARAGPALLRQGLGSPQGKPTPCPQPRPSRTNRSPLRASRWGRARGDAGVTGRGVAGRPGLARPFGRGPDPGRPCVFRVKEMFHQFLLGEDPCSVSCTSTSSWEEGGRPGRRWGGRFGGRGVSPPWSPGSRRGALHEAASLQPCGRRVPHPDGSPVSRHLLEHHPSSRESREGREGNGRPTFCPIFRDPSSCSAVRTVCQDE